MKFNWLGTKKIEKESKDTESLDREQKEFDKVSKMTAKKDSQGLGRWLRKFSEKGAFWFEPKLGKRGKKDLWL